MPTSVRYVFRGKAPWPFLAVFWTGLANFVVLQVLARCYTLVPDAVHTVPVRHRGGEIRFFHPGVGRYLDYGFIAQFVFLGLAAFVMWCYRDQVERVAPPPPRPWSGWDFLLTLALYPVLVSLVGGVVAGLLWREAGPEWGAFSALPFPALSLFAVERVRRQLPDPGAPPLAPWLYRSLALLLSAATMGFIGWRLQ